MRPISSDRRLEGPGPRRPRRAALATALALALALPLLGCGGGGSASAPTRAGGLGGARPDVALLLVSGHDFGGDPAYLRHDAGPELEDDLAGAGLSVATAYYVDDGVGAAGWGGYLALVDDLEFVRDAWAPLGTRVVLVAHSHGGVWSHAAARAVPGLRIDCQVDLDANSHAWGLVGHGDENGLLGGDPRDAFALGVLVAYPQYPAVPSDASGVYDLEDVVFVNVLSNLDVRSAELAPLSATLYDDAWNARPGGSTTGLEGYYSAGSHAEVHQAGGATLAFVRAWLRARLGV